MRTPYDNIVDDRARADAMKHHAEQVTIRALILSVLLLFGFSVWKGCEYDPKTEEIQGAYAKGKADGMEKCLEGGDE